MKITTPLLIIFPLFVHGKVPSFVQASPSLAMKTLMTPLDKTKSAQPDSMPPPHLALRGLQPDPPDPPTLPSPPGEGEPADYCDFLFLFFEAQANTYGYDCECDSSSVQDKVTISCSARSLVCDEYNVGDVDMICHSNHFTTSTTTGTTGNEQDYTVFDFEACGTYADEPYAPTNLAESELCYVYKLSVVWGQGYNLDECGVMFTPKGGTPQQVCTCSVCSTTVGFVTYWGLGLDCQDALLPGISLVQCQALTDTNPAVIPEIEEYRQDDVTSPTSGVVTVPQSTATVATDPATTVAATTIPSPTTADGPASTTTATAAASPSTTVVEVTTDPVEATTTIVGALTTDSPPHTADGPVTTTTPEPTSSGTVLKVTDSLIVGVVSLFI